MCPGERGISAHDTNMSVCRSRCRPSAIRRPLSSSKRANQIAADFVNGLLKLDLFHILATIPRDSGLSSSLSTDAPPEAEMTDLTDERPMRSFPAPAPAPATC